ncbi:MAG: hypothetical protein E2O35_08270 [Proteobacteria bacterium]|nr:MAG: hypothetical protein E2O35_08270 [Pseudomonadota bacterium]
MRRRESPLAHTLRTTKLALFEFDFRDGTVWWSDEMFHRFNLERDRFVPTYENVFDFVHADGRERGCA